MNKPLTPGIRFIVTSLCNYDCIYCHNEWEEKRKPISKLEEGLIRELIVASKSLGGSEVDITGGEPLIKKDRVEAILKVAKEQELWTNLTTNGYYLDRDSKWLSDLSLGEMHIHIPTLNERLYRKLMRGNSDLNKVLEGLDRAVGLIPVIKANIPIEQGVNDNEIPQLVEYFGKRGITPRFIETMATPTYRAGQQRVFDEVVKEKLGGEASLRKSYLWGINEYSIGNNLFETLRCICFDRKCEACSTTNFIHVDQDYKIRPCNLRQFKINATGGECLEQIGEAIRFLQNQTDIPEEYKSVWGKDYVPLSIGMTSKSKDIYNLEENN